MPKGSRWGTRDVVKRGEGGQEWTPTVKQLRYMKARLTMKDGKPTPVREAAEIAGYSTTDTQLKRLSTNPHMQEWMRNLMSENGITEADVIKVMKDALSAEKVSRTTFKGVVTQTHNDVDHTTRLAAARTIGDMMGLVQKRNAGENQDPKRSIVNIILLADEMGTLTDEQLEERMAAHMLGLPDVLADAPAGVTVPLKPQSENNHSDGEAPAASPD